MQVYKKRQLCTACTACSNICPKNAISMNPDEKGFLYPQVDTVACIECGMCKTVCHTYKQEKQHFEENAFAFINDDEQILNHSSSGGAFSYFAKNIIDVGGWVCGAVFDNNLKVMHVVANNKEALANMRGSKYVQSDMKFVFKEVKELLQSGEHVLFTGTPCQVIGLKSYLRAEYDNLICIDVVCHSAPSPLVFEKYLEMKSKEIGIIQSVSFRDKKYGYDNYSVCFRTISGEVREEHKNNFYIRGFTGDLYSRDCCAHCPAKERLGYYSDITLGDLWGADAYAPQIDCGRGASLVVVHTNKGMRILNNVSMIPLDIDKVVEKNPRYRFSHTPNRDSNGFWRVFKKKELSSSYQYIYNPGVIRKIMLKLRKKN